MSSAIYLSLMSVMTKICFIFGWRFFFLKSPKSWQNIGLQFLASGLLIWNPLDFMKSTWIQQISGEIHPKPYKSKCFNQNYSVWWMQKRGYDPRFHEIRGHSPLPAPPNWRVFVETSDFIRFWVDFMNVSFCVMIKYRSFEKRKTNNPFYATSMESEVTVYW